MTTDEETMDIPAGDGFVSSSEAAGAQEFLASRGRLTTGLTSQNGGPRP